MKALIRCFAAALALGLSACVVYEAPPPQIDPMERSFNAAQGAIGDAGLTLVSADRATGTIRGTRGPVEGVFQLRGRPDGRVEVEITARDPGNADPGLSARLTEAYNRRMGR